MANEWLSWAWTPRHVQEVNHQSSGSLLILPYAQTGEACLCHYSRLTSEGEYSWIWLFETMEEALRLKVLPQVLPEWTAIADVDIIEATLPPKGVYLQVFPASWANDPSLGLCNEIQEVRLGFDYRALMTKGWPASYRSYSVSEFQEMARR